MAGKTAYKNKFRSENYDRIFLTVPKGNKALMEEKAQSLGLSLNGYIASLINEDLGLSEKASSNQSQNREMETFLL
ncbi:MAG: hypothetical protein IJD36_02475 [Clostridia bacterium]|nr:hypothetical protein [Clostridia bacterium]